MPRFRSAAPRTGETPATATGLTYPITIAHRGAANLYPENTMPAFDACLAHGLPAIEAGDIQRCSDGGLVVMHDTTVDRTTSATGNVSSLTTAGVQSLVVDSSSWMSVNTPNTKVPMLEDVLDRIGTRAVSFLEVKDGLDATATAMCDRIEARGLKRAVVICSFARSNVQLTAARGFASMLVVTSVASSPTPASLAADGIGFVAMPYTSAGDIPAWVAGMQAVGIKCIAWTVDHQWAYDQVIGQGFDGIFSNDPLYAPRAYAAYRRTSSSWKQNGVFGHGIISNTVGPYTTSLRGNMVGYSANWRWMPPNSSTTAHVVGEICPVANPAGTYTVTYVGAFDTIPSGQPTTGPCMFVAASDDKATVMSGNVINSYLVKLRANGQLAAWRINGSGGAAATFTPITTTAPSAPVLSSGLTAGVPITSLPVNALPVALLAGHQFYLPTTGQVVTLSAGASASATSISVNSVTPSATIPSGGALTVRFTVTATITPTGVTFARADEPTAGSITSSDTAERGAYVLVQNNIVAGQGNSSFESVTVT